EVEAERRGATNRDHHTAVIQELLDRRQRRRGREVALHRRELGRNRSIAAAATAAAATTTTAATTTDSHIARQDDDVVLRLQVASIEVLRVHDVERNFKLLEFVPRPSARHRAAESIGKGDALRRELRRVRGTSARAHEADAEVRR